MPAATTTDADPGQPAAPGPAPRLCVVGSLNVDLVVRAARAPERGETVTGSGFGRFAGGKGGNQACGAARLAGGRLAVGLIGRVGNDAEGTWRRQALARDGVDVAHVGVDEAQPTGVALITVDRQGDNRIVVIPGANQSLTPAVLTDHHQALATADVLLLQLEIPLPTVTTAIRMGREKRAVIILDPAPARALPDSVLRLCDWLTPNETELCALTGHPVAEASELPDDSILKMASSLLARGARQLAVKRGDRGVLLVGAAGSQAVPAFPVTAVDTTAAGDAWNAAFAVALALGQPPPTAARFANAAAALTTTRPGAQPSLPTLAEVEALLGG